MQFRQRLDNFILLTLLGIVIGIVYAFTEHALKGTELVPLMVRATACLVLIFLSIAYMSKALRSWFRGKAFLFSVSWRTLIYASLIIFWLAVINGINEAITDNLPFLEAAIGYIRYSDMFWYNLLTVFIVAMIFTTMMEINTLHRKGELFKYIAGLYVTPKEVQRIFMFADVLNTASRIQDECNRLGELLLVSEQVMEQLHSLAGFTANPLGQMELRGKTEKMSLFGIKKG